MKEKPTGKEKTENNHPYKIIDKKKYYWCLHHNNEQGQWVQHHPDECRNKPNKEENKEEHDQANLVHLLTRNTVKMKKNYGYARVT